MVQGEHEEQRVELWFVSHITYWLITYWLIKTQTIYILSELFCWWCIKTGALWGCPRTTQVKKSWCGQGGHLRGSDTWLETESIRRWRKGMSRAGDSGALALRQGVWSARAKDRDRVSGLCVSLSRVLRVCCWWRRATERFYGNDMVMNKHEILKR